VNSAILLTTDENQRAAHNHVMPLLHLSVTLSNRRLIVHLIPLDQVEQVYYVKLLGVDMNDSLQFEYNTSLICSKSVVREKF